VTAILRVSPVNHYSFPAHSTTYYEQRCCFGIWQQLECLDVLAVLGCSACSQKKLGSVSDEITHHALCNTIVIKVGERTVAGRSSCKP
jgi:hypothetical protein